MTGDQLRAIRLRLELTQQQFGRALGFTGNACQIHVAKMEAGVRNITEPVARLAEMFSKHGVPPRWLRD